MKIFRLLVVALLFPTSAAYAQLPAARLSTVFPPGGRQGTAVDVTVAGVDLDDLTALRFSTPSITAEPKTDPATGKPVANVFVVRIGRGLAPGAYDVRAAGRFGVTNPRAFVVDAVPQAVAPATNTSLAAAADVAVNTGVYAVPIANASQYFKVALKAGQRVFFEIDALAIDSRFDPVCVLFDAAGKELARSADNGLIDYTPASEGPYVVEVHDVLYRGGPEFFYRLRVHANPKVDFILPAAAGDDAPAEWAVHGSHLPGGGKSWRSAMLVGFPEDAADLTTRWFLQPAAATLDGTQVYRFAGGVNPQFIARVASPLVAEQAENDEPTKAQKFAPGVELFGQFFPRNDRDWYTFDAKKGEAFWFEVTSNRVLGVTDPMVLVQRVVKNEKGEETLVDLKEANDAENLGAMPREFNAIHRDPAFGFAAPEDGAYRVMVRDLFNTSEDDARRVYRLSVAPLAERRDFRLVAWPQAPQPFNMPPPAVLTQSWGSNLRPGGVMPVGVLMIPTAGFAGDITLTAEGLPPGVTCPPVVMTAGTISATLLLAAAENAAPFVGAVRVVGTAKTGPDDRVSHAARAGTVVWTVPNLDTDPLRSRVAREFVIAVTAGEVEPITVRPAEEKVWEDSVAGRIEVPVKVTRRVGYNAVVKLKPAGGVAQFVAMPEVDVAAGAADGKVVFDLAALKLGPANYSVYLQATSTAPYDRDPAKRAAAQAAKDAADKATPDLAAAVQKAKDAVAAAKTPEEKDASAKAVTAAEEAVKQNEASKTALAAQVTALAAKDTLAYGYSTPINLKITTAPITLAAAAPATPVKPGGKLDVPVTVTRLYGFADVVDLGVVIPQGVAGLSVANVQISAAATQGVVSVAVAADAKPGDYTLTLAATLKQNNIPLKVEQPIRIQVVAP